MMNPAGDYRMPIWELKKEAPGKNKWPTDILVYADGIGIEDPPGKRTAVHKKGLLERRPIALSAQT